MNKLFGIFLALLTGCASLPEQVIPPKVTLADVAVKDLGLLEQRYTVRLRIHNPNPFDLPLIGTSFQAELNGMPFGQGQGNIPVTIPQLGSALLDAEAYCSVTEMLQQITSRDNRPPKAIRYWIKGRIFTQDGRSFPYESNSEITLPASSGSH